MRHALIADILDGASCGVLLNESYVAEARAYIEALEKDAALWQKHVRRVGGMGRLAGHITCGYCDYDEAEGALMSQCELCAAIEAALAASEPQRGSEQG